MAAFHGKQGKVEWVSGQVSSNLIGWTLDATADVIDTSIAGFEAETAATHWKDYAPTFKDWTGTFTLLVDDGGLDPDLDADIANDADGLAVELFGGILNETGQDNVTPRKYSGNAIITDVAMSTDKEDVARITYTFQGSGAITVGAVD